MNEMGTVKMFKKGVVQGAPKLSKSRGTKCPACMLDKTHRPKIPKRRSTECAFKLLNIVHTDVCGPIDTLSNGEVGILSPSLMITKIGLPLTP